MSGSEIKEILKSNGYQLKNVAENMGISPQNLDEKLKVKQMKIDTIRDIAESINKPLDFFLIKSLGLQSKEQELIPLLPISAQAGTLNDFIISVKESDSERVISPIKGVDFALSISGESMSPEYPNGSQVLCKKINHGAFIDSGRVYVLDTVNGIVIKQIVLMDDGLSVRCYSINKDPIFSPFNINLSDIYGVYRVLMCMSIK